MGVPTDALPDDSVFVGYAYDVAVAYVNTQLECVPGPIYMLAVYNLGGHNLVSWAPDQTGVYFPSPPASTGGTENNLGYFYYLRNAYDLTGFTPGMIESSADETTSQSMAVPEALKELTIGDLMMMKTPWGRQYLQFAQQASTLWGIS